MVKGKKIWLCSIWEKLIPEEKWKLTWVGIHTSRPKRWKTGTDDTWLGDLATNICPKIAKRYFEVLPRRGQCIELNCRFTPARRAKKTGGK